MFAEKNAIFLVLRQKQTLMYDGKICYMHFVFYVIFTYPVTQCVAGAVLQAHSSLIHYLISLCIDSSPLKISS